MVQGSQLLFVHRINKWFGAGCMGAVLPTNLPYLSIAMMEELDELKKAFILGISIR